MISRSTPEIQRYKIRGAIPLALLLPQTVWAKDYESLGEVSHWRLKVTFEVTWSEDRLKRSRNGVNGKSTQKSRTYRNQ